MKILSIIGSLITGVVLILQWYFSDDRTKMRKYKGNEKEKEIFKQRFVCAYEYALDGDKEGRDHYLRLARDDFRSKLRKARALR